jgi:hypothetical protein
MPEHRDFRTGAFVDLHLVDLGSPLTAGGQ